MFNCRDWCVWLTNIHDSSEIFNSVLLHVGMQPMVTVPIKEGFRAAVSELEKEANEAEEQEEDLEQKQQKKQSQQQQQQPQLEETEEEQDEGKDDFGSKWPQEEALEEGNGTKIVVAVEARKRRSLDLQDHITKQSNTSAPLPPRYESVPA